MTNHSNKHTTFELTPRALVVGIILGVLYGASSLYLALKVGITVSASIPVAVISMSLFAALSKTFGLRPANILENNIVQTTGSAGESIAFGIAITMPALLILGERIETTHVLGVAVLGALLGILMMIPLRQALVVEAKDAPFPEGTACAEILKTGEKGGTHAAFIVQGFLVGLVYKICNMGFKLWIDVPEKAISFFKGAMMSVEVSPELLGVGYMIGYKSSFIMVAGGLLSSWVLTPMIALFGSLSDKPLYPGTIPISQMSPHDIWKSYLIYIGAGAVTAGGIFSLFQSLPTILKAMGKGFLKKSSKTPKARAVSILRTEQDLSLKFVIIGCLVLLTCMMVMPTLKVNFLGALLIIALGFLFVTVSARLTGEIGSSVNPISGMTVASLIIISVIFLYLGWVSKNDRIAVLSIAAIICVAIGNAQGTSQDLKTGQLIGATPRLQQISILIGAGISAIFIGFVLNILNNASTVYSKNIPQDDGKPIRINASLLNTLTDREPTHGLYAKSDSHLYRVLQLTEPPTTGGLSKLSVGKYLVDDEGYVRYFVDPGINGVLKTQDNGTPVQKYEAPKARLMSLIIDGILSKKLPWIFVFLGASIALVLEFCGVASLPFAVGVYLPLSASTPVFAGGLVHWIYQAISNRKKQNKQTKATEDVTDYSGTGTLFSCGLIAGGSIAGILIALLSVNGEWIQKIDLSKLVPSVSNGLWAPSVMFFALCMLLLYKATLKGKS